MQLAERGHLPGRSTPPPALGGDAELRRELRRDVPPTQTTLETITVVHQAEERLRPRTQMLERREVSLVGAIGGNRHVHEIDGPPGGIRGDVAHVYRDCEALRVRHVLVPEIAVAQVVAEQDL